MPAYILYGFRWPREGWTGIRVHTIVHNLEDCSSDYIQNAHSREELLVSFRKVMPELMKSVEVQGKSLDFIEPYEPNDETSATAIIQPFAYIAAKVVELGGSSFAQATPSTGEKAAVTSLTLGANMEELISTGHGLASPTLEAIAGMRDQLAPGEKIGWWVVYNGDPERAFDEDEDEYDEEEEEEEGAITPTAERSQPTITPSSGKKSAPVHQTQESGPPVPPKPTTATTTPTEKQVLPTRSKPEPQPLKPEIKPEAVLPPPKNEKIPEPAKFKEVTKKSGFRSKFFGKKI